MVAISSVLLEQVTGHVRSSAQEVCGLLLGTAEAVTGVTACLNVAADPARRFEIDPRTLIGAHRAARHGGPAVIGHYHSHPSGSTRPSAQDAVDASPDGSLWLILTHHDARAWRAVASGTVHERFVPVALTVTD